MRILVSNDDGIHSPGIATLARCAARLGEVRVVAPDVERSAAGHSITASRPVRIRPTHLFDDIAAFRVDGTPADCVALGVHLWGEVDLVLSGINLGANLGNGTWHSGTLAAAQQAALLGIRGIAVSAPVEDDPTQLDPLVPWVDRALAEALAADAPLVNVNLPLNPRGIRWTAQAVHEYHGRVTPDRHPQGGDLYWFTVAPFTSPPEGTDMHAFDDGCVSLTPLRLDLTDHARLEAVTRAHI